jgi:anhydro-N-acetylmuramic acid kinase
MDGVDAALVRIGGPAQSPTLELLDFAIVEYPTSVRRRILRAAAGEPVAAGEISQLNFVVGEIFAQAALAVCRRGHTRLREIAVIGSHGQTIFHQGDARREGAWHVRSTLQIGEPAVIARRTGVPVVADFRKLDMAAGGQGAPLVPWVDYLLLRDPRRGTVALNIGGIANITVIPPKARSSQVTGFDTGPGNMIMDSLVLHLTQGRRAFDRNGEFAAQGKVLPKYLEQMLRLPYFRRQPPKSAGREQFGEAFVRRYFLDKTPRPDGRDLLRTACELTAQSVARALEDFVFPSVRVRRLIVSGGGSHNQTLMARLRQLLPEVRIQLSDDFGLPADAKEAMAFALLAERTLHGLSGNLPSVTGARRAVILGALSQAG